MQPVKTVSCPSCGGKALFTRDNPWRPFCSERCKMIDLGAWASETYRVPLENDTPADEEPSPTPRES